MPMDFPHETGARPGEHFFPAHKELQIPDQRPNFEANERLDHLLIVCAAMWELLRERTNLTEDDLVAKVAEIDARDGTADGKITPTPMQCPQCNHTILSHYRTCIYCGQQLPVESVFKTI